MNALRCSLLAFAILTARLAGAIPQPPHDPAHGIQCAACHTPYAGLSEPATSTGGAGEGSTLTRLTDPTKAWAPSAWVSGVVTFTSGANLGQFREIAASDASSVTWDQPLPAPLAAGDSYKLGKTTYDDIETRCKSCHNPTGLAWSKPHVALHRTRKGVIGCGKCHDPHNIEPNSGVGQSLVRSLVRLGTLRLPAVFPSGGANRFLTGGPGYDGICEVCHTETTHHRDNATGDHGHNASQACTDCHTHDLGFGGAASLACNACHGGADNAAPPADTQGRSDPALPSGGAHQSHVTGTHGFSAPVACTECHLVPSSVDAAGHIGAAPAELTFGALATSGGATPAWDHDSATCATSYCHGAGLPGGSNKTPKWTIVDGSQATCGTCHGNPPPLPHPQSTTCAQCHPETVGADGGIAHPEKHIDGAVQVIELTCNACHGGGANAAPPKDTTGATATTGRGVGAHQSHLGGGAGISAPLDCDACHVTPTLVGDVGHLDSPLPAEIAFGTLAKVAGATPEWQPEATTCAGSYCHGATLKGGSNTAPSWTTVNGTQAACGTCHGAPPPPPHTSFPGCGVCHPATAAIDGSIAHPEKHVDGVLEVQPPACNACHGGATNAAPPGDTQGGTATTLATVGAHQAHLVGSGLASPVACDECHVVPIGVANAGHIDAPPAEVSFGTLATPLGMTPSWNGPAATCSTTYCHGATLSGGTQTLPVWTAVDGSQKTCTSCHGNPPPLPHPQDSACGDCHPATADSSGNVVHPENHIDGNLQVGALECNACHGGAANAAPPNDTAGNTSTGLLSVGAHQSHITAASGLAAPIECGACHTTPTAWSDAGHLDPAPAEIVFGALAATDGASPEWTHATGGCSSTYCHGSTLSGGTNKAPVWTTVDGSQAACGTCHGAPPPPPHTGYPGCAACHDQTTAADGTIAHPEKHVDGLIELSAPTCTTCHGSADNSAPPKDTHGGTDTALAAVGAHQSHVAGTGIALPMACTECHVTPSQWSDAGHIDASPAEVTLVGMGAFGGATPIWDPTATTCANSYCHGVSLSGGTGKTPVWTVVNGTQSTCGSCHGAPPPAPHPQNTHCGLCHPGTADDAGNIVGPANHLDGVVEKVVPGCNGCHGGASNAAPPKDTSGGTATSLATVGAHQTHVVGTAIAGSMDCGECHIKPSDYQASSHMDASPAEVTFGALAQTGGASPVWSAGTATCANSYCHGANLGGGTKKTPIWTTVDGSQMSCTSCHGNPPPAPHPQNAACGKCHPETADMAGGIINPDKHVDGTTQIAALACNSCHGGAANAAPPADTSGGTATSLKSVGAHQAHVAGTGLAAPIACAECHVTPTSWSDAGHLGAAPAEVAFGAVAKTGGLTPVWNVGAATCASSYCHGAGLSGGTKTTPVWTTVDGTQKTCTSCHGNPPPLPHPQNAACGTCHPATADNAGNIIGPAHHVDGVLDLSAMACNACHGSATNAAPPVDTTGGIATSLKSVGAHQPHLLASSAISLPTACTECHVVPTSWSSAGHLDASPAEVVFGVLAKTGSSVATWNTTPKTCSNTYCHGRTLVGGTNKVPVWTTVNNTQDACGTCHGSPPNTGKHAKHVTEKGKKCYECHSDVMTTASNTTINLPAPHINGVVSVKLRLAGTWNPTTKSCSIAGGSSVGCHNSKTW